MRKFWHRLWNWSWDIPECDCKKHVTAQHQQSMDYYMKELDTLRAELQTIQDAFMSKQTFAAEEAEAIKVLGEDYFA